MFYQVGYLKKAEINGKKVIFGKIHIAGLEPIKFVASYKNGIYTLFHSIKDKDGNEIVKAKFAKLWVKKTRNKNFHASGKALIGSQELSVFLLVPQNMNEEHPYEYGIFIGMGEKKSKSQNTQPQPQPEPEYTDDLPDENEDIPF